MGYLAVAEGTHAAALVHARGVFGLGAGEAMISSEGIGRELAPEERASRVRTLIQDV